MKAGEPGVKLRVGSGPKSVGPPGQARAQLSQRDARGEEIMSQRRQGRDPKSKVQHTLHSAFAAPNRDRESMGLTATARSIKNVAIKIK